MFLASLLTIINCLHWLKSYGLHKIFFLLLLFIYNQQTSWTNMLQIIIFIQIIEISILFLNILMIQTHISIIVIDIENIKKTKQKKTTKKQENVWY